MTALNAGIFVTPLDHADAWRWLADSDGAAGALVLFGGQVRGENGQVSGLHLEHYAGMAEKAIHSIAEEIASRWALSGVLAWHRVGDMAVGDTIVICGVTAVHRDVAFEAGQCLMDRIKTGVPLWKKVSGPAGEQWVDARQSDLDAAARWLGEAD